MTKERANATTKYAAVKAIVRSRSAAPRTIPTPVKSQTVAAVARRFNRSPWTKMRP
jgi:hypothetical protein